MYNLTHLLFVYDHYGETDLMQPFSALGPILKIEHAKVSSLMTFSGKMAE